MKPKYLVPFLLLALAPGAAPAQVAPLTGYADLADLALAAPIVAEAVIRKAQRLTADEAGAVPAGFSRQLVTAEVQRLIVGPGGLPAKILYLVDVPLDARGKPPKLARAAVLLFLAAEPGRADRLRLVARQGQIAATSAATETVRAILEARDTPEGKVAVTGIASAFHVPGTLPGESETQIFLATRSGAPVSLSVLRRPGETPRWSVALGELVDEAAKPPARDTLLWYRLACALPPQIPARRLRALEPDEARAVASDYAFVLDALGACGRTISAPAP